MLIKSAQNYAAINGSVREKLTTTLDREAARDPACMTSAQTFNCSGEKQRVYSTKGRSCKCCKSTPTDLTIYILDSRKSRKKVKTFIFLKDKHEYRETNICKEYPVIKRLLCTTERRQHHHNCLHIRVLLNSHRACMHSIVGMHIYLWIIKHAAAARRLEIFGYGVHRQQQQQQQQQQSLVNVRLVRLVRLVRFGLSFS